MHDAGLKIPQRVVRYSSILTQSLVSYYLAMTEQAEQFFDPPAQSNSGGDVRRVGVELEFNGLGALQAAELVKATFGGQINTLSDHRYEIQTSDYGSFVCELDTTYAHPNASLLAQQDPNAELVAFDRSLSKMVGDISEGIVPTEIVSPPLPYPSLPKLTSLLQALRDKGAGGTDSSIIAGFGVHLNIELESLEAKDICALLKSYLIWSPKLRELIQVDPTRSLMPYVDPFPQRYVQHVLSTDYWPDQDALIGDYLADNPTRNRELDLLPLFRHLDEQKVVTALDDDRIKARPAYHYRLPNMNLSDQTWSVVTEWNRWVQVERLAADSEALEHAAAAALAETSGSTISELLNPILQRFSL